MDAEGRLVPAAGLIEPTFPVSAPNIPVEVWTPDGRLLAETITDAGGNYSVFLNYGENAPATPVIVRVTARVKLPFGVVVQVLPNDGATEPYSHETPPTGDPDDAVMRGNLTIPLGGGAGAYRLANVLYDAFLIAKEGILGEMADLDVYWEPGNGDVSSYERDGVRGRLTIAGGNAGDDASNRDVWDPARVVRLMGEHLLAFHMHLVVPEGTPNDALMVPSLAWREGLLDFWACIGRRSAVFVDTEGIGASGRVVRYFNIDSFFDGSLARLGPDDPNVYQPADVVGIGSRFSVAEVLWDIHKFLPLVFSFRLLESQRSGFTYPYLYTLLDGLTFDNTVDPVTVDTTLREPEDQGMVYPATVFNDLLWPPQISSDAAPGAGVSFPFSKTMDDVVDTETSQPQNFEVGLGAQRYFLIDIVQDGSLTAEVQTAGDLTVQILDLNNRVLASGASPQSANNLPAARYIIRVLSNANPQVAPYQLTVSVGPP